ncbi:MAG TPA: sensor histidine kinase [Actinomycetales bacterium]|nr:sensor histidine kinase [Actinomycetales bacterium]
MTEHSPAPTTAAPPSAVRRAARTWAAGWGAACQLISDLLLAVPYLLVIAAAVLGVFLTVVAGVGLLLLVATALAAYLVGFLERARLAAFTGVDLAAPPPPPHTTSFWRRWIFNGRPWKALVYLLLIGLWGLVAGSAVLFATTASLVATLLPAYAGALPDDRLQLLGYSLATDDAWWVPIVGIAGLLLVVPLVSALLVRVDIGLVRLLLGADRGEEVDALSARVVTLTETRERTVDSVELERRRIERDLHDGPQQRLVAIAMDLGMARTRLDSDVEGARALLDKAHAATKEAITEMRQVARGIHPPVLTDRGLDAALSALAARSPVPVDVSVRLPSRPSPTVEAIAYFCVSEALTNVAKHSRASRAKVDVGYHDGSLIVVVQDNGCGGAQVGTGTGLVGLANRVAAVDGRLDVHSPRGGPTSVTVRLPWIPANLSGREPPERRAQPDNPYQPQESAR